MTPHCRYLDQNIYIFFVLGSFSALWLQFFPVWQEAIPSHAAHV